MKNLNFVLRNHEGIDIEETSLDEIFSEDDSDVEGSNSGSDGYLSEVLKPIMQYHFFNFPFDSSGRSFNINVNTL